jgi:hypothetical protein
MGYTTGRILDKKTCHAIAKTYTSRSAFQKNDPSAYNKAWRMGWVGEWFGTKTRQSSFTKEKCCELAKQCRYRAEFKRLNGQAYRISLRNGWIDDYTWFLSKSVVSAELNRKHTDEEVEMAARKYTRMKDFMHKDYNMYNVAQKRGMLKKFTWLKTNLEAASRKYKDCVYAYEFRRTKTAYIGRSIEPARRDYQHHLPGDCVFEYANTHKVNIPRMKIVMDGFNPDAGAMVECRIIEQYREAGWTLLNKIKGGGLGAINSGKYDKKYCMAKAQKFIYLSDMMNENQVLYQNLRKNGWIKECTWLIYKKNPNNTWSKMPKEQMRKIAAKFSSRQAFRKGSTCAYEIARRKGWISEWFPTSVTAPKKVGKFDRMTGKLLETYHSTTEAARKNHVKAPSIGATCRGQYKTCKGFVFKYLTK